MLFGLFGFAVAAVYIASGVLIAITAGVVLGRMRLERYVEPFVFETNMPTCADPAAGVQWSERFAYARGEVRSILGRVWPYLLLGIALGAVIHGWVPADALASIAGKDNPFAVPIAVLIGVPLYSNAAGVLPLVAALHAKGMAMGTVLAFMMAVTALSLPGNDPAAASAESAADRHLGRRPDRVDHLHRPALQLHPLTRPGERTNVHPNHHHDSSPRPRLQALRGARGRHPRGRRTNSACTPPSRRSPTTRRWRNSA